MSFSREDYENYCKDVQYINAVYSEVISSKKELFRVISDKIKGVFKKYLGEYPDNLHFSNDGSLIEVTYNLTGNFSNNRLPLDSYLVKELHMPVQIKILDSNRLVFILLPKLEDDT